MPDEKPTTYHEWHAAWRDWLSGGEDGPVPDLGSLSTTDKARAVDDMAKWSHGVGVVLGIAFGRRRH